MKAIIRPSETIVAVPTPPTACFQAAGAFTLLGLFLLIIKNR